MKLIVKKCKDFELTGDGSSPEWQQAEWQKMTYLGAEEQSYSTRCKTVYSDTGIYFLVDCEDQVISCSFTEDMQPIFTEDVFEVFLDPAYAESGQQRVYFEYELSPLDKELVLLVPNDEEVFHGWLPWHYEGDRRIRHATNIKGGEKLPMASCTGWQAECFIPFALLSGLANGTPESGTQWRGNIYRIDYDKGASGHWAWNDATGGNFHNYNKFGILKFE